MKYITNVPLIGGMTLANMEATGEKPLAISSWPDFYDNDKLLLDYFDLKSIDVSFYDLNNEANLEKLKDLGKLDFISSMPPCSGLSGASSTSCADNPVNEWMYKCATIAMRDLKPKVYFFENAKELYTNSGKLVRKKLNKIAKDNGYAVTYYKTSTLLHGIPQERLRTFAIFVEGDEAAILNFQKVKYTPILEYLKQIPIWATFQNTYDYKIDPSIGNLETVQFLKYYWGENWKFHYLQYANNNGRSGLWEVVKKANLYDPMRNYALDASVINYKLIKEIDKVELDVSIGKGIRSSYQVIIVDGEPYYYSIYGEGMIRYIHPEEERRLNIRELMHMMGLPHDFQLDPLKYNTLAQNVPFDTAKFITNEVIEIINGNREFHYSDVFMIDNIANSKSLKKTKKLF